MEWGVRVDARKHVLEFKGEAWDRQNSKMTPMVVADSHLGAWVVPVTRMKYHRHDCATLYGKRDSAAVIN